MLYIILIPPVVIALMILMLHISFIPPRMQEHKTPLNRGMKYQQLSISTQKNKQLFAWLIPAKITAQNQMQALTERFSHHLEHSTPLVIMVHGWGSNAELMLPVAELFNQVDCHVILFDARCHGNSDNDSYAALPRFTEDIQAVADFARNKLAYKGKIILLGHSVGAGAALYAASLRSDIAAVISLAAFANPEQVMSRYFKKYHLPDLMTNFFLAYVQWLIGHKFDEIAPENTIKKITVPVLLVHGKDDRTIPVTDAYRIHNNNPESQLLIIEGAGHKLINRLKSHGSLLTEFLKAVRVE